MGVSSISPTTIQAYPITSNPRLVLQENNWTDLPHKVENEAVLYLKIVLGVPATNLVLEFGPSFQIPTLEGYDIIGWDVRGAGQSTPLLTCFPDQAARMAYLGTALKILVEIQTILLLRKASWRISNMQRPLAKPAKSTRVSFFHTPTPQTTQRICTSTPSWQPQEQEQLRHSGAIKKLG